MSEHSVLSYNELLAEIIKLKKENKAMSLELDEVRKAGIDLLFELRKVQQSRDELLGALKLAKTISERDGLSGQSFMRTAIQKAEQQKEETK